MRVNLPVTTREYPFPRGETLVSTTDLQGRMLYCNPMFIEVSGYTREELLGQPHNMIRHPDMPEEAFRDMWATISSGLPWSAPVKNRRKDGDFYWVMANVTPLIEGDRPVGYMSVRTEATREQTQAAEALYARMRAEKESGRQVLALQAARLVSNTPLGRVAQALRLGMGTKVWMACAVVFLACLLASLAGTPLSGMGAAAAWLAALAVAAGAAFYISSAAVAPLGQMVRAANRMAAGDLTQSLQVTHSDLMGDLQKALSQLNVNLLSIVRDAREESEKMRNATQEIARGNRDLSSRTETQASSLEETAASMEEITGTVKLTAESASKASQMANRATDVAERTSEAVNSVADTMKQIQAASGRIGEITQLIDSIAFQTNILALNAAVEAARAGEQGRGFAVVAQEVRSLSHRTQTAAKEIRALIDDSAAKVQEGHRKTDGAQTTMGESLELVRDMSALIGEIHSAANEQLSGISQINSAVAHLDTITQQNAALVEHSAGLAQQLQTQAQTVTETVQIFRVAAGTSAATRQDAVSLRKAMKAQQAQAGSSSQAMLEQA